MCGNRFVMHCRFIMHRGGLSSAGGGLFGLGSSRHEVDKFFMVCEDFGTGFILSVPRCQGGNYYCWVIIGCFGDVSRLECGDGYGVHQWWVCVAVGYCECLWLRYCGEGV